jgi:eukaryotic-like serine/threonine-protein kinase
MQKTSMGQMQKILVNKFLTYEDTAYGFKIEYPADWDKVQFSPGITQGPNNMVVNFLSPPRGPSQTFREYLLIEAANMTSAVSNLSTFSKQELSFLAQSFPHFTPVLVNSSSSLAGHNANTVVFTYSDPIVGTAKAMEIWAMIGPKGYILSYHADSSDYISYLPSIENMIHSFGIITK